VTGVGEREYVVEADGLFHSHQLLLLQFLQEALQNLEGEFQAFLQRCQAGGAIGPNGPQD
jgi:hypothetical protein